MFESPKLIKHFNDSADFDRLPIRNFLMIGDKQNKDKWFMPYKNFDGDIVEYLLDWYGDIMFDYGKEYRKSNVANAISKGWIEHLGKEEASEKYKGVRFDAKRKIKNVNITKEGYVGDYDTLVNLKIRLELLFFTDSYLRAQNYKIVEKGATVTIYQGSATRAEFRIKSPHKIYIFGLSRVLLNSGLTKRFFDFDIYKR